MIEIVNDIVLGRRRYALLDQLTSSVSSYLALDCHHRAFHLKIGDCAAANASLCSEHETLDFLGGVSPQHPGVLTPHEFGRTDSGDVYLLRSYIPGKNVLEAYCAGVFFSAQDVAHVISGAASALQHCHDHGVLHRDVKPSNLLLEDLVAPKQGADLNGMTVATALPLHSRLVHLVDFGLALCGYPSSQDDRLVGTEKYNPGEVFLYNSYSLASDQYSLAVTAYLLTTGRFPFKTIEEILRHDPVPPFAWPDSLCTETMSVVILRGLEKDPACRYESVSAFAEAFVDAVKQG